MSVTLWANSWQHFTEVLSYPFMQRAVLGGMIIGALGGGLGSLAVVRQFSFFSHTVSHAALLGVVISVALGWNPTWVLLPFTVVFGVGVLLLIRTTGLWSDTVLNLTFSGSLAVAVIGLSGLPGYRGNLNSVLFGDILAIQDQDIWVSLAVLILSLGLILVSLRPHLVVILHPGMAKAQGIPIWLYDLGFVVLLSLGVAVATKAVGVLLVNAFLVMPAATSRLLSRQFGQFLGMAMLGGSGSAVIGILLAGILNWPAGPSVVVAQIGLFGMTLGYRWVGQES